MSLDFYNEGDGVHRWWHVYPEGQEVLENIQTLINLIGAGSYTPSGVTTAGAGGIAQGTDLGTAPISVQDMFDKIFYPPQSPHTTISSVPSAGLYEKGDDQATVDLSSTTTQGANPITSFIYKKNGTTIYTDPTPTPTGGTETYSDTDGISSNTTYEAIVSDGTLSGNASLSFSFVAAYYYGVADAGLDVSTDGGGLTKLVIVDSPTIALIFNPVFPQVYYFMYPSSYPDLTSILDTNGFETISDWTKTTVAVTNGFGNTENYTVYAFNNPTTTVNFKNTFIQ